uniref:CRAL-TRIO domain-containing protein n=2 Tax=Dendroctonus ponderosae TaxID=77166 RepID=A0AAR5Q9D2_DENPD
MAGSKILINDEDIFWKQLYEEFRKDKADLLEYVDIMQKWADSQPHFPERPSHEILRFVILYNKFSIEKAKAKLDMYYSIRNLMPEYFQTHPLSADIVFHSKVCLMVPLPKPTSDYSRIIYNTLNPEYDDPKHLNHDIFISSFIHVLECLIREDLCYKFHYIMDCKPVTMGHIAKFKPMGFKKVFIILEKVFSNRLASICLVNVADYCESFINVVVKPILSAKMKERLKIVSNFELTQIYGKERLPRDAGGDLKSLSEMNDLLIEYYETKKDVFDKLEKLTVDESLRPAKLKNDEILGYYGNFKKIHLIIRSAIKIKMNFNNLLHTNKEEVRSAVLEKLGKSADDIENDKQLLKNWFQYQTHLPEVPCDSVLELFLIVNKFNLEKCKKKLCNYYTIRNEIPDMYVNKNPKFDHMKDIANTVYVIPLPKLTPSLSRVTLIKLKDFDPVKFKPLNFFAHTYNIVEIRIREDVLLTDSIIYDMEGCQAKHLMKMRLGLLRNSATILEKVFSTRLEGIHYINLPSSMQVIVNLMKTLLKEKMRKRLHVHKDLESLQKHFSKEILPQEYGGECRSIIELHELWLRKLDHHQELFDHLDTLLPPSSNNASQEIEVNIPENCVSNFQQLCID